MSIDNSKAMMLIIYVENQEKARDFYKQVLAMEPLMDVPGMTEFKLDKNVLLGIMPNEGIARILEGKVKSLGKSAAVPKCELYLPVDDPDEYYHRLIKAGGTGIVEGKARPWGDYTAYGMDPDGNLIAFAKSTNK